MIVYRFAQNSHDFDMVIPSGFDDLSGVTTMTLYVSKPDGTTSFSYNLNGTNIYNEAYIKFTPTMGNLDQIGIYDYQVTNTSTPKSKKGDVLQFRVDYSLN